MKTNLLRTLALSIVFCLVSNFSQAQWVPIPDPGFVTWLNANGYAACMNGNLMDTTCPAVVNATSVDCSNSYVRNITGISYFDSLYVLKCDNDSLTFLPALPVNLTDLRCSKNQLTQLPSLPNLLRNLRCYDNTKLTSLPQMPNSLYYLECHNDSLTLLPTLPNSLGYLFCGVNFLDSLPQLPASLWVLECGSNRLTTLPVLPAGLGRLNCSDNSFTIGLPPLPSSLYSLECGGDSLNFLPALPSSLKTLVCRRNQLSILPILPSNIRKLDFSYNPMTSFPLLPDSLESLSCEKVNVLALPTLPPRLQSLSCSENNLLVLPSLPNTLVVLVCRSCNLTALPEFPDSLYWCFIESNHNLHCLPRLKRIVRFYFSQTGIACLPNYGHVTNSTPPLNTIPLCDANNVNGCTDYWNLSGRVYYDADSNCIKDGMDTAQRNIKVLKLHSGSVVEQAFTGGEGFYSFDNDTFSIFQLTIDTTNIPFYVSCPANNLFTDTLTLVDSFDYDNNFALHCKPGFDIAARSVYGFPFRQANFTAVNILAGDLTNFYGAHCAAGVSGDVTVSISGPAKYIAPLGGALTPSTVSGNLLTYNIADFGNVNFFTDFGITVQTDTTAQIGQQVCFEVTASPFVGDNNQSNNSKKICFSVVGSFDPNEKEVYPAGNTDTATKWLTYTIHFQNTGNAEAQNIHIDDTLDVNLDASTLELLAYSFQPTLSIKDRAVRFNFIGINLPDSVNNEPLSHGYVQYRIKVKDNLPIGTQIRNTAFIYFDFNAAVVTNTTSNTISTTVGGISSLSTQHSTFSIYPNPANNSVAVSIDESLIGSTLIITDITGRRVAAVTAVSSAIRIPTSAFAPGVYFVTLEGERGRVTKKLMKQ